jgi:hypothetical protein
MADHQSGKVLVSDQGNVSPVSVWSYDRMSVPVLDTVLLARMGGYAMCIGYLLHPQALEGRNQAFR